ncbi:MAG: DUF4215 domain-containing protein [Myxococcota bacterium]|nr:DUF4215 domain-containing protein [Myxococcota bacterium]
MRILVPTIALILSACGHDSTRLDDGPMDAQPQPRQDGSMDSALQARLDSGDDATVPDSHNRADANVSLDAEVADSGLSASDLGLRDQAVLPNLDWHLDGATQPDSSIRIDMGVDFGLMSDAAHIPEDAIIAMDAQLEDVPPLPICGNGIQEADEDCDDGNQNQRDRCTNECRFNIPCPGPVPACLDRDDWAPNLDEHHMVPQHRCAFRLNAPSADAWDDGHDLINRLADAIGNRRNISGVLNDLNREGRFGVTNQTATRLRNHDYVGFVWNNGDMDVSYWYPQGITGTSDAYDNGRLNGRRLIMVSWYHRTDNRPTKGARISLVDLTNPNDIRYRHLLLVRPIAFPGGVDYRAVRYDHGDNDALHAGGIVWLGNHLYVADTRVGMRVFDLNNIMRVSLTDDSDLVGLSDDGSRAHNYRYIVPQIARYELTDDSCAYSFSAISLDRSTNPPTILSAEYRSSDIQSRLVHWPVDMNNQRLMDIDGRVDGRGTVMAAQTRVQGALSWRGDYYISSSSQYLRFGRLYRTRPNFGESSISAWVYGCEDLYYERDTNLIWTPAEFPNFRDVVSIPLRTP